MCPLDPRFVVTSQIAFRTSKTNSPNHTLESRMERESEWASETDRTDGKQEQTIAGKQLRGPERKRPGDKQKTDIERERGTASWRQSSVPHTHTHTHTQPPTFPVLHSGFIVSVHVAAVTQTNKNTSNQQLNLFARVRVHKRWLNECGRDGDYGRVDSNAFLCDKNSSGIRLLCRYGRRSFVKHSDWKSPALPSDNNEGWEERETDSMLCVSIIMKPQAPQSDCITTKIAS